MKIKPVKGTNDYTPAQTRLRDYMQNTILDIYKSYGFEKIQTPAIEDMENLKKSEGGENLNLLFEIMKRGDKLTKAIEAGDYTALSDIGLRYDLTLPLCRYYANNRNELMKPFKCIQMDKVYRAERPQKGRLREFMQCDIDILGSDSWTCEVELISATTKALLTLGFDNMTVVVNDRRLLAATLEKFGFGEDSFDTLCISLDKLDKIGNEGVLDELIEKGFNEDNVNALLSFIGKDNLSLDDIKNECGDIEAVRNLSNIINEVQTISNDKFNIVLELTLVRGQGYYTGTVFEVKSPEFRGAIAGGGRYDNLVGKFIGESVPAVGFSIGFERIFGILEEKKFIIPDVKKNIAIVYDIEVFSTALKKAQELRTQNNVAMYVSTKKLGKMLDKLEQNGFEKAIVIYADGQDKVIEFEK